MGMVIYGEKCDDERNCKKSRCKYGDSLKGDSRIRYGVGAELRAMIKATADEMGYTYTGIGDGFRRGRRYISELL